MALNTWIGANITEDGETTIPARLLTDLIRTFPNQNINLESDNATIPLIFSVVLLILI